MCSLQKKPAQTRCKYTLADDEARSTGGQVLKPPRHPQAEKEDLPKDDQQDLATVNRPTPHIFRVQFVCVHTYTCVCIYIYIYAYIYHKHINIYMYICICIKVCVYVYIYIYMLSPPPMVSPRSPISENSFRQTKATKAYNPGP